MKQACHNLGISSKNSRKTTHARNQTSFLVRNIIPQVHNHFHTHWGKNGNFLLKIEKSDIKIGPIFGFKPLVDTLTYPKIPFSGQDSVWFGQGALLNMWKISENFTLSIKLL